MYLRRESGETEVEKFPRGKTVSFQESSSSLPTANFLLFKQKKNIFAKKDLSPFRNIWNGAKQKVPNTGRSYGLKIVRLSTIYM